jgi:hypothetical protein
MDFTIQVLGSSTRDFKKLNHIEIQEQCKVTIAKQVCSVDWGSLKKNIKISAYGKF